MCSVLVRDAGPQGLLFLTLFSLKAMFLRSILISVFVSNLLLLAGLMVVYLKTTRTHKLPCKVQALKMSPPLGTASTVLVPLCRSSKRSLCREL